MTFDDNPHTRESGIEGPQFDARPALDQIRERIARARRHYRAIVAAMQAIEDAGMWPAVPGESWETRRQNPDWQYLRLRWHQDADGRWDGPHGRRTTYIGSDPDRVALAQAWIRNRRRWERLERERHRLWTWLNLQAAELRQIAARADSYPGADLRKLQPERPDVPTQTVHSLEAALRPPETMGEDTPGEDTPGGS
jgi:hypothetical protein